MNHDVDIAIKLLGSKVICDISDRENYKRLVQDDKTLLRVENILESLNRKLIKSESGKAFYAVNAELNANTKKEAKEYFKFLVEDARYYLDLLEFFAEQLQRDVYVQAGHQIEYTDIVRSLTHSNSLQDKLKLVLGKKAESDVSKMATRLFDELLKKELIAVQDSQKLKYRFTGKLELIQQGLIFIVEQNRLGVQQDQAKSVQKGLQL